MANEVHIRGLADLQKFLDQLPVKMEKNVFTRDFATHQNSLPTIPMRAPISTPLLRLCLFF